MFLKTLKINAKWRLKHELFRRVLPTLQYEPNAIRHLSYEAWPKIATLTAKQDFPEGIESVDWRAINLPDDGSEMIQARAQNSTPLILRNYAEGCPPASWSMDTLKSEFGREKVTVLVGDYVSEFGQPRNISMRLGDFIDYLHGRAKFPRQNLLVDGLDPYVGNQLMPALADQLPRPDFFSPRKNADSSQRDLVTFWLGSADAKTPLHCHHFCDTFVIQLIGRRSFTLIPPDQALMVGYMPQNINIGMAAFDPYAPDKDKFPGADDIRIFDIDLGPGDALLLPGFWFHAVKLVAPSMSGSRFVRSKMPAALGGGPTRPWRNAGSFVRGF